MDKRKLPEMDASDDHGTANGIKLRRASEKASDKLINDANDLHWDNFKALYVDEAMTRYSVDTNIAAQSFQIGFKASSQLTKAERIECLHLIQSTSRLDYEASSWGWNPKRKMREMREDEMRYLLVRADHVNTQQFDSDTSGSVQGFLSFMLTHDSTPSVPVVYIYEIHLAEPLRKLRLGAHLMESVESIAAKVAVDKVMLTCFISNTKAQQFYTRRGYRIDACSPQERQTRKNVVRPDYIIMSKDVT